MTETEDNIHKFTGLRRVPICEDYAEVGKFLDDLKELWENGEIGSMAVIYNDKKNTLVTSDWIFLPGISLIEGIGWAHCLINDLIKATKK